MFAFENITKTLNFFYLTLTFLICIGCLISHMAALI
jgi:hypothetical protein